MGKLEKAIARLKSLPKDYTYSEAKSLLTALGFLEHNKGRTSGSRTMFHKDGKRILLHKPHPSDEMKQYAVKQLKEELESLEEIS